MEFTEIENLKNAALVGNNPDAQFELGQLYEFGKGVEQNYQKALEWYTRSAEAGLSKAEYSIGLLYEQGRGVAENYTMAAAWYQKAAEKNDPWALNNLAFLYSHGRGVEQSDEKANELYIQAANLGHFQAQYNLAARYASGRGMEVDLISAYFWFERSQLGASALNQERAKKMIEVISEHMSKEDIATAKARYEELFRQKK